MSNFSSVIRRIRGSLSNVDDQPISAAVWVILIFLDFFVLVAIWIGLANSTLHWSASEMHYPGYCYEFANKEYFQAPDELGRIAEVVDLFADEVALDSAVGLPNAPIATLCLPVRDGLQAVVANDEVSAALADIIELKSTKWALNSELDMVKDVLEPVSGETLAPIDQTETGEAQRRLVDLRQRLNASLNREAKLRDTLEAAPEIMVLMQLRSNLDDLRAALDADRRANFGSLSPAQVFFEVLFLAPLVGLFLFWYLRASAKGNSWQDLIAAHLLVVACIPLAWTLGEFLLDVLPFDILSALIALMASLNIMALWYYLVIGAAVLVAVLCIRFFQKHLFSRDKQIRKRIANRQCQQCGYGFGYALDDDNNVCPHCGFAQYRVCEECQQPTFALSAFCKACGVSSAGRLAAGER